MLVVALPWVGGLVPVPSLLDALLDMLDGSVPALMAEVPTDGAAPMALPAAARTDSGGMLLNGALLGGWVLASLALAFVFGRALWRVQIARRRAAGTQAVDSIEVIRSESLGPATVGIVRPAIVLPRWVDDLPESERALILWHECEHARARDPLLLAAALLVVVAVPWCLPLWWMHRRLRDAAETDCDARVVARGADRLAYGRALLRAAGRPRRVASAFAAPLLGGVDVTRLERRILTMTERRSKHAHFRAIPLVGVAAVAAVFACDAAGDPLGHSPRDIRTGQQRPDENVTPAIDALQLYRRAVELAEVSEKHASDSPSQARRDTVILVSQAERERAMVLRMRSLEEANRKSRVASGMTAPGSVQRAAATVSELVRVQLRPPQERASDGSGEPAVFYINDERVGDSSAALDRLDPSMIERIEVIKGPRAALYGPGHSGGVVNIYTKNR